MKNWVVFVISGRDLNPEEINQILQIKPDRVKFNEYDGTVSWQINSSLEGKKELLDHIEDILKKIYHTRKNILHLSKRFKVQIICNVDKNTNFIEIPSRYLAILGSLGIDLYVYF